MNTFTEHTNIISELEFIDMFHKSTEAMERLDNLTNKLDEIDFPMSTHISSNLNSMIDHRNLRFVETGNYDFTPARMILDSMMKGINHLPEAQRLVQLAYKHLTDYENCNFNVVNNALNTISNIPNIGISDLYTILLGFSQLYSKRTLVNDSGVRRAYDEEDLNKALVLFDLMKKVTNVLSTYEVGEDIESIDSSIRILKMSINSSSSSLKGFCNMIITYVKKMISVNLKDHLEVTRIASKAINEDKGLEDNTTLLEHVEPRGLFASKMEEVKKQSKLQIVNILVEAFGDVSITGKQSLDIDVASDIDGDSLIARSINTLKGRVEKSSIKRYGKNLTLEIGPSDVFKLNHSDKVGKLSTINSSDGSPIYIVANHSNLKLVAKDTVNSDIVLISLIQDNDKISSLINFQLEEGDKGDRESLPCVRLKFRDSKDIRYKEELGLTNVSEGLKFSEDGGIKLTYKPKKSYMDEYAEAHKIIHANYTARNYEAMKTDLAFLFAFINHIESQVIYSRKPVKASKKEDATKARMFAINDFKTYLKKVQEHEPTFDFTRYFEKIDTSKVLVEFSNSEIKGIRKLLRTILSF